MATQQWFRAASPRGTVSLGGAIYSLGRLWAKEEVEITFDPTDQYLSFRLADGKLTDHQPLKDLSVASLMGAASPMLRLDQFQLALPFAWSDWQLIRLCETLPL